MNTVMAASLNLRIGPSTNAKVITRLGQGTPLVLADLPSVITGTIVWKPVIYWVAVEEHGLKYVG